MNEYPRASLLLYSQCKLVVYVVRVGGGGGGGFIDWHVNKHSCVAMQCLRKKKKRWRRCLSVVEEER